MADLIQDVLFLGRESAIKARDLCAMLGISARDLTQQIEAERRAGAPICASCRKPHGYFLARTQEEMRQYCDSLSRRAREIFVTRSACLRTLPTLPGEPDAEGGDADANCC